jgi:hypothetical protein
MIFRSVIPWGFSAFMLSMAPTFGAVLLSDYDLGGLQETVYWEAMQDSAGNVAAGGYLSGANTSNLTTEGVGTIAPVLPGYKASTGYYSYQGNFGLEATTSIQDTSTGFTDIQNVVFQRVAMTPTDVTTSLGFDGGPQLSLYSGDTLIAIISADYSLAGTDTVSGTTSNPGTYYSFNYQWDLSGYAEEITRISIYAPIEAHGSTIEAQIDIGGTFTAVLVPEPTGVLMTCLGAGLLLVRRKR